MKKSILLHICCGPCAIAIVKDLQARKFSVTGFFYNPNIQPLDEYKKRLDSLRKLFEKKNIPLIYEEASDNYDASFQKVIYNNTARPGRCLSCYNLRLRQTAQQAKEQDIKYFTSTLLSSPHQDISKIRDLGLKYAKMYNLEFYSPDYGPKKYKGFRPLFTTGRKLAHQAKLYEQDYCGCLLSKQERFANSSK